MTRRATPKIAQKVRSMKELAIVTGISYCSIKNYSRLPGWPGRDIASGWYNVAPCRDFILANSTKLGADEESPEEKKVKDQIDDEKLRKLKIENDEKSGLLVSKAELVAVAAPDLQNLKDFIYQKLGNEIPTAMAKVDVPTGRTIGVRYADEIMLKLEAIFNRWIL